MKIRTGDSQGGKCGQGTSEWTEKVSVLEPEQRNRRSRNASGAYQLWKEIVTREWKRKGINRSQKNVCNELECKKRDIKMKYKKKKKDQK